MNKENCALTLNLLTTTIVAPSSNASKWQMGYNLAFKGLMSIQFWTLTLNLLTTTIVAPPTNASKWQMGLNLAFKGLMSIQFCTLTLNLLTTTIVAPPSNASKWQMGFNSTFKGLIIVIQISHVKSDSTGGEASSHKEAKGGRSSVKHNSGKTKHIML